MNKAQIEVILDELSSHQLRSIVFRLLNVDRVDWRETAKRHYANGQRVSAIRECRAATGWGLKEAKEYCDAQFPGPDGNYY